MVEAASGEFEGLRLGDARLEARARKTVVALAARPSGGTPTVLSPAELEAYYRFVNNERVSFSALLAAHVEATLGRARKRERIVVAHDTTDFRFADEEPREGLGPMDNGGQGFYAHFSLALAPKRQALGVVGAETWTRTSRTATKQTQMQRYDDPTKESLRWMRSVRETNERFEDATRVIHVMDREADDYDILCELVESGIGFVVRASYDRRLPAQGEDSSPRLKSFARILDVRCKRTAQLSSRRKNRSAKERKVHPPRDGRSASLAFAACAVTLRRPDKSKAKLAELTLNVVHVSEPAPPEGCEPVEWLLYTREPVDTDEQIFQVADDYRSRWVIEEFFKALKTGCAYEKRQHETKDALLNALGIFIPIAWSLLNMRTISREKASTSRPAHDVLNPIQLQILCLESKGRMTTTASLREAVLWMAKLLGGLQPGNGDPGWHVLGRAFEKLLTLEAGWRLALAARGKNGPTRCDL
jgi:hypothetical protein